MTYNKLVQYPSDESITQEAVDNGPLIADRPPYQRLKRKIYLAQTIAS